MNAHYPRSAENEPFQIAFIDMIVNPFIEGAALQKAVCGDKFHNRFELKIEFRPAGWFFITVVITS